MTRRCHARSVHFPRACCARAKRRSPRLDLQTLEPRVVPAPILATGTDAGVSAQVKVHDAETQALKFTLTPFPSWFKGGVRVAVADVTGDGTADVITAQGPGGQNGVRVFNGETGKALKGTLGGFTGFPMSQANGLWVAAGDVTGDGKADILVGSDGDGTPRARVFSGANGALVRNEDLSGLNLKGGVRVAAGDVNADGKADVIVASGPGGPGRVAAFDGANDKALFAVFAFDLNYQGGVTLAAGDIDGDGFADVVAGQGQSGSLVKVISGKDRAATSTVTAFESFTGGVRVGTVDANADGRLDVVAAQGPGGKDARVFWAARSTEQMTLAPFGGSFAGGLFAAGDQRPGDGGITILSDPPDVSIVALADAVEGSGDVKFRISRTGDTSASLNVFVTQSGTATPMFDVGVTAPAVIDKGQAYVDIEISANSDSAFEGPETIILTIDPDSAYDVVSPSAAATVVIDEDSTLVAPREDCGCGNLETAPQARPMLVRGGAVSASGVRLADGLVAVAGMDLYSGGFGQPTAVAREWTNGFGLDAAGYDGDGMVAAQLPYLRTDGTDVLAVTSCAAVEYFDGSLGGYAPRHLSQDSLTHNSGAGEFTLTTSAGARLVFNDFGAMLPAEQQGQVKSVTDPNGNVTSITSRDSNGKPLDIQRTSTTGGTTTTESFLYAYVSGGVNDGKVESVTLRRQVGSGSWTTIRKVEYAYYTGTESAGQDHGTAGDLKTAVVKDSGGVVLDQQYFRYFKTSTSAGYAGALKYAFNGDSYERLKAADSTPEDATDSFVASFASEAFEYDAVRRIVKHTQQGTGCSACAGGLGESTFAYTTSTFADGYNSWRTKTVETRADGNTVTTFTNFAGQPVLEVYEDTAANLEFATFSKYDSVGRLVLRANPSAVSGYDETKADLLDNQSGNYQHLRDSQGLVETTSYYSSTTATSSTAGGVNGYLHQTHLKRGETGTDVLWRTADYFSRTDGSITVFPVASDTRYRNSDGTGGQTTSYAYTYFSGSIQPEQITTTLPAVTTGQNGSGSADSVTVVMNERGRVIWEKDQAGFLTHYAYDDVTGALTAVTQDVDHTKTGTFTGLPSGWTTPSGGGLHFTSTYDVDTLGRTTKATDANGIVTYLVHIEAAAGNETRVYPGWDSTNNVPTGPTIVQRHDRTRNYVEVLTMSATPATSGGKPTGTEAIGGIQSLSRQVMNDAGQTVYSDQYFDLTSVTYSQSSVTLGTSGTNFYRAEQAYDKQGLPTRTVSPTGTIYRTVNDGRGLVVSKWVGTDDTPTSGFWSPTNTAGTDLVMVWSGKYDAGGVGDGLLTEATEFPGSPHANRVTQYAHDWRTRVVAVKAGVESSESTSLNRPISYTEFDNLGQPIVSEMYDGDGLSIATDANSDGVPDRPSSSALRAKSTADFDELGRVYQSKTFSVDPANGNVSTNSLVSKSWFNSRGLVMKSSSPGGLVTKNEFNGVGWTTKSYLTDGGGDSAYGDADDVTGDAVLSQTEWAYDSNGNAELVTVRERFHDETATGALGTPSTGVKARVSYRASYFDKADRIVADVDVGTNGGSAYTRPASVPSRSDTVLVTEFGYNAAGWVETTTDPKGLVGKQFYDLMGRTTKTIENYVNGVVSDADDKTVEYTYHPNGQTKTLKALLTGGGYQTTEWVLGITSPIVSNDILKEMRYPDPSSGNASTTEKDAYTYNQLGQRLTFTDRNGNVHTYSYDVLGRITMDAVTTLGSGVDGTVRRIEYAYDTQGNLFKITSFDAVSGGNVVNEVQREFNGLGQLTKEYQAVNGAVNTGSTSFVQYTYSFSASGSVNPSRLIAITYPNGRVLDYNYATGLADNISRLSSITVGSTTLESYEYLGYGIVVKRGHAEPGVDLTYIKLSGESDGEAGDKYIGIDRFGRVIDQRWTTSGGTAKDRWAYGYDRNGNRKYKENLVESTRSELYAYDSLNQLTSFSRGTLNGNKDAISGSPSRTQAWDFDALGNFDSQTTDGSGQTRTHNKQNEITSVQNATTPTYDANGNLTKDETGRTFNYDAWNRLVEVRDSGNNLVATFRYDGTGRRVRETRGSATTDLYYSDQWQVLEERVGSAVKVSYVWSPIYIDAMIARDRDTDGNGSLDERLYAVQDANFNVVALLDTSGAVVERFAFDAFGVFSVLTPAWASRPGSNYAWVYLHQGGRWDSDGGVYSFRRREYNPTLGRWLQVDPLGVPAGDLNLYRYIANDPNANLDPSGLQGITDFIGGAGAALGGGIISIARPGWNAGRRCLPGGLLLPQIPAPQQPPPVNRDPCAKFTRKVVTDFRIKSVKVTGTSPDDIPVFEKIMVGQEVATLEALMALIKRGADAQGIHVGKVVGADFWAQKELSHPKWFFDGVKPLPCADDPTKVVRRENVEGTIQQSFLISQEPLERATVFVDVLITYLGTVTEYGQKSVPPKWGD
jgi:RHS repeat-associated protein